MTALPPLRRALGALPRAHGHPVPAAPGPSSLPARARQPAPTSQARQAQTSVYAPSGRAVGLHGARDDAAGPSSRRRTALRRARPGAATRPCGASHGRCLTTAASPLSGSTVAPPPYDIFFCGTDDFASHVLSRLIATPALYSRIAVLVPPAPRASSRAKRILTSRPVAELAARHGIDVHEVPAAGLQAFEPPLTSAASLLLTASFGHLIPPGMLSHWPERQRLNVHPSLLPLLRGAAPIQWAIARRQPTGVSIQELGQKFDTGRLLAQTPLDAAAAPRDANYSTLKAVLADAAAELLVRTLADLPRLSAKAEPQAGPSSRAPKVLRSHSLIDWCAPASSILAQHRAFGYLFPLHTVFRKRAVQLHEVSAFPATERLPKLLRSEATPPGAAVITQHGLVVKCGAASLPQKEQALVVTSLQTEGKQRKTASAWETGYALNAAQVRGGELPRFGGAAEGPGAGNT